MAEHVASGLERATFTTVPRILMAALMLIGIGINFANVVTRYVFGFAIFWAEEILIFVSIWGVFIGSVAAAYRGEHLRMDLLSAALPSPWREGVNGLATGTFLACGVYMVVHSLSIVVLFGAAGQVSVTASVPMVVPHSAFLLGFALMVVAVLVRLRAYITGRF